MYRYVAMLLKTFIHECNFLFFYFLQYTEGQSANQPLNHRRMLPEENLPESMPAPGEPPKGHPANPSKNHSRRVLPALPKMVPAPREPLKVHRLYMYTNYIYSTLN